MLTVNTYRKNTIEWDKRPSFQETEKCLTHVRKYLGIKWVFSKGIKMGKMLSTILVVTGGLETYRLDIY